MINEKERREWEHKFMRLALIVSVVLVGTILIAILCALEGQSKLFISTIMALIGQLILDIYLMNKAKKLRA